MASLGNDLAAIRKRLNLSLDDIHNITRIPLHILESIEDGSIFTTLEENPTYKRSYIRSYAKAVKIPDDTIVQALDEAENGDYSGSLMGKDAGEARRRFTYDGDEEPLDQKAEDPAAQEPEETLEGGDSSESEEHPAFAQPRVPPPPTVGSVDWADMGKKFAPMETRSKVWVGLLLLLILSTAGLFLYLYLQDVNPNADPGSSMNETNTTEPVIAPDSLQLGLNTPPQEAQNDTLGNRALTGRNMDVLPDTLELLVYAAYDKLEPVRVFTDVMDAINPYWIEQGHAFVYEFVNAIHIRGQYSRMELIVNGHLIPNFRQQFYDPDLRMLRIDRDFFENDPRWLEPPSSDSLAIDAPMPVIMERPRFE